MFKRGDIVSYQGNKILSHTHRFVLDNNFTGIYYMDGRFDNFRAVGPYKPDDITSYTIVTEIFKRDYIDV